MSQGEKGGTREGPFNNRPDSGPEERRLWLASSLGALPESSARIESLASLSAVGLGGPVVVVRVATAKGLGLFFGAIAGSPHGFAVIGGCSNVLFPDLGLGIPVAKLEGDFGKIEVSGATIAAGAGASMAVLLEASQKNGLSGLEMTAGLPGTVGGAAMGNAGSGQLGLAELVEELELAGPNFGRAVLGRRELSPAYRSLGLPKEFRGSAITRVTLKLAPSDSDRVREEATKALASRKQSQPAGPSLGCVFKNPPGFSAGQLIDQCGLKGQACGGIVVSEKHANFFIKRGQSVSEDFTSLAAMARDKVLSDKGILLEPEIKIWSSEGQDIGLPGPAAGR